MKRRLSFSVEVCQAIKEACGPDFLIESKIRVTDVPGELTDPLSITKKEAVELAKIWEGSVDLLMEVGGTTELRNWVLSFGAGAEVLEPQSLRAEVASELERALARYRPRPHRG